jgi:signal transduction histidine kinase
VRNLLFIVLIFASICRSQSQTNIIDSLRSTLNSTPNNQKIQVYQAIITKLWRNHPDSALIYARKAIRFADQSNDLKSKAVAVRLQGGAYVYMGDYDSGLFFCKQACTLSIQSRDSTLIASSLSNLGEIYTLMGSYPEGIENLLHSISIKRKINQQYGLANTLNSISLVYMKLKDYEKAKKFATEVMNLPDFHGDKNEKTNASNILGFSYLYMNELDSAKKHFLFSISIAEKSYDQRWYAAAVSGLGQVYLNSNQENEARINFNKALGIYVKLNDKVGVSEVYHLISKIQAKKKNIDSAFYFLRLSEKSAESTGSRERKLDNYRLREDLYTQIEKYDSALRYKSKYVELHDLMFSEGLMRTLSNIELRVAEEEAQRIVAAKDIVIQKKTLQTYLLIAILMLGLIFGIVLYRSYKVIKERTLALVRSKEEIVFKAKLLEEANNEINTKNEELEQQTEEIISQRNSLSAAQLIIESKNNELKEINTLLEQKVQLRTQELHKAIEDLRESNKELDHFIYRSSHDLKGPLARLLGLSNLGKMESKEPETKVYFEKLESTANEMNEMLRKLINIHEINLKAIEEVNINLSAKVNDMFEATNNKLKSQSKVRLENQINDKFQLKIDTILMENLFSIITENAIRYCDHLKNDPYLEVTANQNKTTVHIYFTDNGVGISDELKAQIFNMFFVGNNDHKGHGLGLYEAKLIAKKLNGDIVLKESQKGLTKFEVILPL